MACGVPCQLGQPAVRRVTVESKWGHESCDSPKPVHNDTFCCGDGVLEQICNTSIACQGMHNCIMEDFLLLWAFVVVANSGNRDFQCPWKEWNPPCKEKLLGRSTTQVKDLFINYHLTYAIFNESSSALLNCDSSSISHVKIRNTKNRPR